MGEQERQTDREKESMKRLGARARWGGGGGRSETDRQTDRQRERGGERKGGESREIIKELDWILTFSRQRRIT